MAASKRAGRAKEPDKRRFRDMKTVAGGLPPVVVIPVCDYGQFEAHEAFVSRLRTNHSRKSGFWPLVAHSGGRRELRGR